MFEGFRHHRIDTDHAIIDTVTAGDGPALILLHGFPQTRAAWAKVAPALTADFTVIVPDLRGYGRSEGPEPDAENTAYSKRAMAQDILAVARALGHETFALVGHDRGGRVAYRLALDYPERVTGLALLDIMTTLDTWEGMDWQATIAAYHWPFLAQDADFVETMIGHDPDFYLNHLINRWIGLGSALSDEAMHDYLEAIRKPSVIRAMAADYRAGATVDVEIDRADRNTGQRLQHPLLILRGEQYATNPMAPAWHPWVDEITEFPLDCGHFIAEEEPDATISALRSHFL